MVEDAGIEPAYVLFPKQETLLESDPRIRLEIFARALVGSEGFEPSPRRVRTVCSAS
jgi:hypothetical protein